jgi:chromosome segregation protein
MVEEFAEIERKLAEELKSSGTQNISSEEFLNLKKKLSTANQLISALEKQGDQKKALQDQLLVELQKLNELWLAEFNLIKEELDKVGASGSSISITSGYKEDKAELIAFMKDIFRGSGIRETTYQGIAEEYVDL